MFFKIFWAFLGRPKFHFGVVQGDADIGRDLFLIALMHLGTIFNDLNSFGINFAGSGDRF